MWCISAEGRQHPVKVFSYARFIRADTKWIRKGPVRTLERPGDGAPRHGSSIAIAKVDQCSLQPSGSLQVMGFGPEWNEGLVNPASWQARAHSLG